LEIVSIDEGIEIDSRESQYENADLPSLEVVQPASNAKYRSARQYLKHDFEMVSIDEGIKTR
jgi:hypothetical protein